MVLTAQQLDALMPDASQLLSHEPEMESSVHYAQLALLVACLEWLWRDSPVDTGYKRNDFFIGANLTVYFSRQQLRNRDFRGPDFFLVRQTEPHPRNSWVVWEEDGKYPDLIIELLSQSTARVDRTTKKTLYQDRFRTPEYFWFSPETLEFEGFRLVGNAYQPIPATAAGWRWSNVLELYLGIENRQLRYFTPDGTIVPSPAEAAEQAELQLTIARQEKEQERQEKEQERQEKEQERQEKEAAQQRAERLADRLRALGIEPE